MPERKSTPTEAKKATDVVRGVIEDIAREGARKVLQAALEAEVEEHLARYRALEDREGRRVVVRNGHAPARTILTGVGDVEVRRPRLDERRAEGGAGHERFASGILPRFQRRTPTLEGALAALYLKGVSTNDFPTALAAILGEGAAGLSATTISRLKKGWEREYEGWRQRSLEGQEYAYIWADGVHFNVRLEEDRTCILVVVGANYRGEKELLAVRDGFRESEQSWKEVLLDLQGRGLEIDPKLAIADGALSLLEGPAADLPHHALPTVLGAQNRQRAGQAAQEHAGPGEDGATRHLPCRGQGAGAEGVQPVSEDLPGQVPAGGGVPAQGRGVVVPLLRLPRGALAAHQEHQREARACSPR